MKFPKFDQNTRVANDTLKLSEVIKICSTGRVMMKLPYESAQVTGHGDSLRLHFLNAAYDVAMQMSAAEARILAYKLLIKAESAPQEAKPILKGVRLLLARRLLRGIQ